MRSCDSIKVETVVVQSATGQLFSTDTSSIAVTNYDLPIKKSPSDSTLPFPPSSVKSSVSSRLPSVNFVAFQRFPFQRSSVKSSVSSKLTPVNWVGSYFERSSQTTACNATSFGECSSTLLDRLWYLYSYIYRLTTTICYGIYIFLNSQHTRPFRLLPSVKHTTTLSASTPLFTTSSFTTQSTLQLSILLESASALFLSITSGIFLVNLADVDNEDNDLGSPTGPDIRCEFQSLHASPFWLLAILKPTTPFISIPLCTTSSTSHLLAFLESTVPSLPPPSWTFFVIFFLSPVGAVGRDTDFHLTLLRLRSSSGTTCTAPGIVQVIVPTILVPTILRSKRLNSWTFFVNLSLSPIGAVDASGHDTIFHLIDQGKVGYLYHLQILLFNLQDASSSLFTLLLILRKYDEDKNDNNGSTSTDEAPYDYYSGDTAVSIALSSIVIVSVVDETMDSVLMMKSYDQFDTAFTSASHALPSYDTDSSSSSSSSLYDNNFTDGTNDNIMSSSIVDTATTVSVSADDELMSAVTQTIISYGTCTTNDGRTGENDIDSSFATVFDGRTGNNDDNYGDITLSISFIVHFDTVIAIIVAIATTASDNNDNPTDAAISISLINSPFHIIDHGSLVYLILLQIRFYDQQDSLLLLENNNNTAMECLIAVNDGIISADNDTVSSADITNTITSYAVTTDVACITAVPVIMKISSAIYDEDSFVGNDSPAAVTILTTAIIMMTTVFHESSSVIHDEIFSTVADAVTRTTTSHESPSYDIDSSSSSICDGNSSALKIMTTTVPVTYEATSSAVRSTTSNELPSAGNDSTSQSSFHSSFNHGDIFGCDTDNYDDGITVSTSDIVSLKLYDTVYYLNFDTTFYTVYDATSSVAVMMKVYDMTYNTTVSVADEATFSVSTTTTPSPSIVIDTESSITAGNDSPATVTLRIYDTVYILYFDTTFDTTSNTAFTATQSITSTSHVFPYNNIDSLLPAAYNEVSFTGNNERSSVAVTTKTYDLLQATFILILTSSSRHCRRFMGHYA